MFCGTQYLLPVPISIVCKLRYPESIMVQSTECKQSPHLELCSFAAAFAQGGSFQSGGSSGGGQGGGKGGGGGATDAKRIVKQG